MRRWLLLLVFAAPAVLHVVIVHVKAHA